MSDSYVCSKAKIKCSFGDKISTLTVFPSRTIWLTGEPQANISDHISMMNIAPFGKCHTVSYPATGSATAAAHGKLTPMPCIPNTPFPWLGGKSDVLLQGQPALLKSSKCKCVWGGTITFTVDGQVDGTYSELETVNPSTKEELDNEAEVQLSPEELLDGLQMALDAAGMFPGLGAIPDLLNACISACRGDWANAGLCLFAAIPGIGDAAGAAKLLKNGSKITTKSKKVKKTGKVFDEVGAKRAQKQAAAHRQELVEKGIADGTVKRIEQKRVTEVVRDGTTGQPIEIKSQIGSTRVETIQVNNKIEPIQGSQMNFGSSSGGMNKQTTGITPREVGVKKGDSIFGEGPVDNKPTSAGDNKVISIESKLKEVKEKRNSLSGDKQQFGI